jgi:phosphate transport system substrate-binding protein
MIAALLAAAALAPAQPTVTLSGSTTALPVVADLAYFYGRATPDAPRFAIVGGGTQTGINDTARGITSAGMVSRDLNAQDPPGLTLTPIALSGVCLVTNQANPVPGLTHAQVQELVSGRTTAWSQVPGSPRGDTIVPVALDGTTGARSVFDSVFVDPATTVAYTPRTFLTAAQVRQFVQATPAAVGYVDAAFTDGLHVLRYDGVACNRSTIRSGTYPARRPLGLVTRGRPRGPVARFLRWIGESRKARQVVASRYLTVSR